MATYLEDEFIFEYEDENQEEAELYVKSEIEVASGGFIYWVYQEKGKTGDLCWLLKKIAPHLLKDIENEVYNRGEKLREEAAA